MKVALLLLKLAMPIHEFYSPACCSGRDCHPVPCEEITSVADGWMWQGLLFKRETLQDAPDSNCHVCVIPSQSVLGPLNPLNQAKPQCIYLPPRT